MSKKTSSTMGAEERVAVALAARRETTVGELATAMGLGQSTVGKALAALEAQGLACRSLGGRDGGRRLPDRWSALPAAGRHQQQRAANAAGTAGGEAGPPTKAGGRPPGRLRPGQLREVVVGLLVDCTVPASPTLLAKAAGNRSPGAVGNCLERLVADGLAVRASDRPKTYLPVASAAPRRPAP